MAVILHPYTMSIGIVTGILLLKIWYISVIMCYGKSLLTAADALRQFGEGNPAIADILSKLEPGNARYIR